MTDNRPKSLADLSAFGPPTAEFVIKGTLWYLFFSAVAIAAGIGLIYWYLADGRGFLLFAGSVSILMGVVAPVYFIACAWGLRVLVFSTGIAVVFYQRVRYSAWSDIHAIYLNKELVAAESSGIDGSVWVEIAPDALELARDYPWDWTMQFITAAGERFAFQSNYEKFNELARLVQQATFSLYMPLAREGFQAGKSIPFGPLRVDANGIADDRGCLNWQNFDKIAFRGTKVFGPNESKGPKLQIYARGQQVPWFSEDVERIPNIHILLAITREAVGPNPTAGQSQ